MGPLVFGAVSVGLVVLVVGAEALVRGAASLAVHLGLHPVLVGLTVVAFGTSAPEAAIGITASAAGEPEVALGNVVGSNIANGLLILGVAALIRPLVVTARIVRIDVPLVLVTSLVVTAMALDGELDRLDGVVLVLGLVAYGWWTVRSEHRAVTDLGKPAAPPSERLWFPVVLVVVGLAMLVVGGQLLVWGATEVAAALGVSEVVIGLTVVAVGTSLPELATTALAARRGHADLAFGNIVGSNLLNLLFVLALSVLVAGGIDVGGSLVSRDLPVMVLSAFLLMVVLWRGATVNRWEGLLLVAGFVAYTTHVVFEAVQHWSLPAFELGLLVVVPPIVVVLSVLGYRGLRDGLPTSP
jgi:cation:H+ antiporter